MPLFVVAIQADESELLTLGEWRAMKARSKVLFEVADHPLSEELEAEGVATALLVDMPPADDEYIAVVLEPHSPHLLTLASAGATISAGPAAPPDAMTAAIGAPIGRRAGKSLSELALVMARLRGPGGCPWDHEQTHESLQVHLLEEAHEVLEAIDRGMTGADLEEKLGDLLLQVFFHAEMAADDGRFDIDGVARRIVGKLVHRHPHVFVDRSVSGPAEVVANWETLKAEEKSDRSGPFDGIPAGLPALLAAYKSQKRAATLGFDGSEEDARARVTAALRADDLGAALFGIVALAWALGVEPESALRRATKAFQDSY